MTFWEEMVLFCCEVGGGHTIWQCQKNFQNEWVIHSVLWMLLTAPITYTFNSTLYRDQIVPLTWVQHPQQARPEGKISVPNENMPVVLTMNHPLWEHSCCTLSHFRHPSPTLFFVRNTMSGWVGGLCPCSDSCRRHYVDTSKCFEK